MEVANIIRSSYPARPGAGRGGQRVSSYLSTLQRAAGRPDPLAGPRAAPLPAGTGGGPAEDRGWPGTLRRRPARAAQTAPARWPAGPFPPRSASPGRNGCATCARWGRGCDATPSRGGAGSCRACGSGGNVAGCGGRGPIGPTRRNGPGLRGRTPRRPCCGSGTMGRGISIPPCWHGQRGRQSRCCGCPPMRRGPIRPSSAGAGSRRSTCPTIDWRRTEPPCKPTSRAC